MVWPFKWNLYSSTFTWYYLLSMWLNLLSLWIDHSYETCSTFFSNFQLIFQCIFNFYISLFERVPKLSITPIFPLKGTQRVNKKQQCQTGCEVRTAKSCFHWTWHSKERSKYKHTYAPLPIDGIAIDLIFFSSANVNMFFTALSRFSVDSASSPQVGLWTWMTYWAFRFRPSQMAAVNNTKRVNS